MFSFIKTKHFHANIKIEVYYLLHLSYMGVFRFANPGSDIKKMISTFRTIYSELKSNEVFSHDDGRDAMIKHGLMSSSGAIGKEAVKRSERDDRSRDPLYNQHKMYSEIFRMLGWYKPGTQRTNFRFTEFGTYLAEATSTLQDKHFEFSALHIVSPNPLVDVKGGNSIRPFPLILRLANDLGGLITKDELILGVLNCQDDQDEKTYFNTLSKIQSCRGDINKINNEIKLFLSQNNISHVTAQNYTRFPIATMKYLGWFISQPDKSLYKTSIISFVLTSKGKEQNSSLKSCIDIRYDDIIDYEDEPRLSFIILMVYTNFEKIGYEPNHKHMEVLEKKCAKLLEDFKISNRKNVLFSPIQECPPTLLALAFDWDEKT